MGYEARWWDPGILEGASTLLPQGPCIKRETAGMPPAPHTPLGIRCIPTSLGPPASSPCPQGGLFFFFMQGQGDDRKCQFYKMKKFWKLLYNKANALNAPELYIQKCWRGYIYMLQVLYHN